MYCKPRLSRADWVALAIVALLFAMMIPVFGQSIALQKELAHRTTCATHLRALMTQMMLYAAGNADSYPMLPPPKNATTYDVTFKPDEGAADSAASIAALYQKPKHTDNPSAALWLLVLQGTKPSFFICPSDPFNNQMAKASTKPTDDDGLPKDPKDAGNFYLNFQSPKNISYSSAYPWAVDKDGKVTTSAVWKDTTDASLPIFSDMAPYLGAKFPAATRPAGSDPENAVDPQWAVTRANSQNHQFDGQNVGFGDAHVDFCRVPIEGQNNDSLWGIRTSPLEVPTSLVEEPIEAGTLPHAPAGTPGTQDVVMVPTRDAKGDLK